MLLMKRSARHRHDDHLLVAASSRVPVTFPRFGACFFSSLLWYLCVCVYICVCCTYILSMYYSKFAD